MYGSEVLDGIERGSALSQSNSIRDENEVESPG